MSKKRVRARRWRRQYKRYNLELRRFRGEHGYWTTVGHEQLRWEEYEAKLLAEGKEPPDPEECPF
jgi:hypothetical protein